MCSRGRLQPFTRGYTLHKKGETRITIDTVAKFSLHSPPISNFTCLDRFAGWEGGKKNRVHVKVRSVKVVVRCRWGWCRWRCRWRWGQCRWRRIWCCWWQGGAAVRGGRRRSYCWRGSSSGGAGGARLKRWRMQSGDSVIGERGGSWLDCAGALL